MSKLKYLFLFVLMLLLPLSGCSLDDSSSTTSKPHEGNIALLSEIINTIGDINYIEKDYDVVNFGEFYTGGGKMAFVDGYDVNVSFFEKHKVLLIATEFEYQFLSDKINVNYINIMYGDTQSKIALDVAFSNISCTGHDVDMTAIEFANYLYTLNIETIYNYLVTAKLLE